MTQCHVAVIDIGKTNVKLALVDLAGLEEIAVVTRPNTVISGPPYPHFDVEGHWAFLLNGLNRFNAEYGIDAISITTHGACAALLDAEGALAAPILDYEHTGPDTLTSDYDPMRPAFEETGSPRLPMGLNVGAQLHWQFAIDPDLKIRTTTIVTYPQYWGHRLTGIPATDVTSLGCHTDLWDPHNRRFSSLCDRLGITEKIAPPRTPGEILGTILPEIAESVGLSPETPVYSGVHDSNASLLPHLMSHTAPFSVVSTGTWVIAMAVGGKPVTLDPSRDTLVNVNAFGNPVPSARFMGGREHDLATGGAYPDPADEDIAGILADQIMLLPAVLPETGPFKGRDTVWVGAEPAAARRGAAVSFYLALVTAHCLILIGHSGKVIVEGPFARNRSYLYMLRAATGEQVIAMPGTTGTSQGAALLACHQGEMKSHISPPSIQDHVFEVAMKRYAQEWTARLGE